MTTKPQRLNFIKNLNPGESSICPPFSVLCHLFSVFCYPFSALCFLPSAERSEVPARRETIFMQNKPNLRKAQINVTSFTIANYEENRPPNPPKANPKQTQFNPIQTQFNPIKSQSNPIQTQFPALPPSTNPQLPKANDPVYTSCRQNHTAEEDVAEGKKRITPYWRTLKTGGILNEKYPDGIENLKRRLKAEGHKVIQKGKSKHFMVEDFEKSLVKQL